MARHQKNLVVKVGWGYSCPADGLLARCEIESLGWEAGGQRRGELHSLPFFINTSLASLEFVCLALSSRAENAWQTHSFSNQALNLLPFQGDICNFKIAWRKTVKFNPKNTLQVMEFQTANGQGDKSTAWNPPSLMVFILVNRTLVKSRSEYPLLPQLSCLCPVLVCWKHLKGGAGEPSVISGI